MPKRAVFERSHRELSLDVSIGVQILLVGGQSSLESQSRGVCKDADTYGTLVLKNVTKRHSSSDHMPAQKTRTGVYKTDIYLQKARSLC